MFCGGLECPRFRRVRSSARVVIGFNIYGAINAVMELAIPQDLQCKPGVVLIPKPASARLITRIL